MDWRLEGGKVIVQVTIAEAWEERLWWTVWTLLSVVLYLPTACSVPSLLLILGAGFCKGDR